jgi:hypothetical protein
MAAPTPSFPDTKFYILQAPPYFVVGNVPRSFGAINCDRSDVEGIELELASPVRGTLFIQVYVRTFGLAEPEELDSQHSFKLSYPKLRGNLWVRFPLDRPVQSKFRDDGLIRRIEIVLAFSGKGVLGIGSPPRPYPARHV